MKLPRGIIRLPYSGCLIAKDEPAVIRIQTKHVDIVNNTYYRIEDYDFDNGVLAYCHGNWRDFYDRFGIQRSPRTTYAGGARHEAPISYSVATHTGDPRLPNLTVIPNWFTNQDRGLALSWAILGCAPGRHYTPDGRGNDLQSIYEFHSYGMLVLCATGTGPELWVARPGDKVVVSGACHIGLYNLGDERNPLVTLDVSHSTPSPVDDALPKNFGPALLAFYNDFEVVFRLNSTYINNSSNTASVSLPSPPTDESEHEVRIQRSGRWGLGRFLYETLMQDSEVACRFERIGLKIRQSSPKAALPPRDQAGAKRTYVYLPLADSSEEGTKVYEYFSPASSSAASRPTAAPRQSIAEKAREIAAEKESQIQGTLLNRPSGTVFVVIIEGVGDWVTKTYRDLLKRKAVSLRDARGPGKQIRVVYADDTRWKGKRPDWADPAKWEDPAGSFDPLRTGLQGWERYLDKSNEADFDVYNALNPDVVFVVTPDVTHSEIAQWWLGKTPLVFIEKPFDGHLSNVNELLQARGRGPSLRSLRWLFDTKIFGLDHYQYYALPITEVYDEIEKHLDGALAKAIFFMIEARPIEAGRDRSLQHGLTLDLLPHLLALLTYFGDIQTIDEIQVIDAAQYQPLNAVDEKTRAVEDISERFHSETSSRIRFTFRDYSENGHRVTCTAVVGKGFSREVKYLELLGRSGKSLRIDLNKAVNGADPHYPVSSLFLMDDALMNETQAQPPGVTSVTDPYNPARTLYIPGSTRPYPSERPLDRDRYAKLLDGLISGDGAAAASTLFVTEGEEIVRILDRVWWAVRDSVPYSRHALGELNP
jgi:hypothetical protein